MTQRVGQLLGSGYEGKVFASSLDHHKVIKEFLLFKKSGSQTIDNSSNILQVIEISKLAAAAGVGPKIYDIFYGADGKKIYIEMDRVIPTHPSEKDVDDIIHLYEKMLRHRFVSFDSEFAKNPRTGDWVFIDFGVTKTYPSYKQALHDAIANDLFQDVGAGYYHKKLASHFQQKKKT